MGTHQIIGIGAAEIHLSLLIGYTNFDRFEYKKKTYKVAL